MTEIIPESVPTQTRSVRSRQWTHGWLALLFLVTVVGIILGWRFETGKEKRARANVDSNLHDFGLAAIGTAGQHVFTINNEGNGPLLLEKAPTTCNCARFELDKLKVGPGESARVTVNWKLEKNSLAEFSQIATVKTNDPERPELQFALKGHVTELLQVQPSNPWSFGEISSGGSPEIRGSLFSPILDQMEIARIQTSSPLISVDTIPLSADALRELKARSGRQLLVRIPAEIPIGQIREYITVDVVGAPEPKRIDVTGLHHGPLQIVGPGWNPQRMVLDLGSFPARTGKQTELTVFIDDLKDVSVEEVQCELDGVHVSWRDIDGVQGDRRRYRLQFEIQPGAAPTARSAKHPLFVLLKTNRAEIGVIRIRLHFVSY